MKKTVAVGLSGGVDSAVSAFLLKQQGFDVTGVFLYCFNQSKISCTADEDRKMAVKIAGTLHIPIKIIDLRRDYRRSVIDYFFSEYRAGRTPNPDVVCNKEIKFGLFYKKAIDNWGMDFVATGHYARIISNFKSPITNYKLAQGLDKNKDQSYFLYTLNEKQLEHILFPIGGYKKEKVRKIAKENKLPNWDRPDSQGICFIGEINIKKFLNTKFKIQKGAVVNSKGEIIGEHEGVWFYTIGQRHGFKIMNNLKCTIYNDERKPLYILSKNSERNELTVGEKEECFSREIILENFHWINSTVILAKAGIYDNNHIDSCFHRNDKESLKARIRHLGELYEISNLSTSLKLRRASKSQISNNRVVIKLAKPAFAVAPGQSAVIYLDDIVLGGGIICQ